MYENTRKTMKREGGRERKTQSNLRIQRWINGLVEEVNSRESEIQNACGLQGQSVLPKLGIRKGSGKWGGWHVIDPTTQSGDFSIQVWGLQHVCNQPQAMQKRDLYLMQNTCQTCSRAFHILGVEDKGTKENMYLLGSYMTTLIAQVSCHKCSGLLLAFGSQNP